jgi:hypothetical protein
MEFVATAVSNGKGFMSQQISMELTQQKKLFLASKKT